MRWFGRLSGLAVLGLGLGLGLLGAATPWQADAQTGPAVPAPSYNPPDGAPSETAVLSGGCFWGMQGVYEHVRGVIHVYAGYTGGAADTAQYALVSTGETGHAESVQIIFDPKIISYGKILQIYFTVAADPTELDYQGPDSGTQYRSEIWAAGPVQAKIAADYIAQLTKARVFAAPIVVQVAPVMPFYHAEDYHQDFLVRHPDNPYIVINDIPKIQNLAADFPKFYRTAPLLARPRN